MSIAPRVGRACQEVSGKKIIIFFSRAALVLALLLPGRAATAGNILRRLPSTSGGSASADQTAAAAAAAAALARQQASPLYQAMNTIKAWQASQDAARASAAAQSSNVPDGLGRNGLDVVSASNISLPTQATAGDGRITVDLVQQASRAVVTWNTFNVGKNTDVYFDQRAGGVEARSWAVLNRVEDPKGRPSQILGSIKAEGQVYILNRNNILFGGTSQVNVGTLVLSGLDVMVPGSTNPTLDQRNQRFLSGTLYDLSFGGPGGSVTVEAGASLKADGGRILLLGTEVRNRGYLQSDDGQVLLDAAGTITFSQNLDAVRGLIPGSSDGKGVVENTGVISAARGNITLVAGETRQYGLLTATTGAESNGSIFLGADGMHTEFGSGSVTQVLPDQGGKKVFGSGESFKSSSIQVRGNEIDVLDGARLYAPAGLISLSALMTKDPAPADPNHPAPTELDTSKVYVGAGASLDVSGLIDVPVAMEQNTITAQLRANELRDNPLVRAGALRGRTVQFDARLGGKLADGSGVANLSGYYDLLERDVRQLMTAGGSVRIAANQIITRPGSVVDLSGGNLRYLDGYVRRTVLIDSSGKLVPLENAVLGVPYIGIDGDFVVAHPRWGVSETFATSLNHSAPRFEGGYAQGSSAGALALGTNSPKWFADIVLGPTDPNPVNPSSVAAVRILEGDVVANTSPGAKQRGASTGSTDPTLIWQQRPLGATLQIDGSGDLTISADQTPLGAGFGPNSQVDPSRFYQHSLPASWFDGKTFSVVSISAGRDANNPYVRLENRAPGGHLAIGSGVVVNLGDYGSFSFSGKGAEIDGTLLAPGGKVSLTTLDRPCTGGPACEANPDPERSLTLQLGAAGRIDVAGRLTNDFLDGLNHPLRPLNGGSVSLTGARILLDAGSSVDVSGGAAIDASGAKITGGNGGSIVIDVSRYPVPSSDPSTLSTPYLGEPGQEQLVRLGTLDGRALGLGGSLTIRTGHDVAIGSALASDAAPGTLLFIPDFFTRGGFAAYNLQGGMGVKILPSTTIAPSVSAFVFPQNGAELPSGTLLSDVSGSALLPEGLRRPMQLSLSASGATGRGANPGVLEMAKGSKIAMEPGSAVSLTSSDLMDVEGSIDAPGGNIALAVTGSSLWVGAQTLQIGYSAQLLSRGYSDTALLGGVPVRSVHAAGKVTLSSRNAVVIAPGAVVDVSGIPGIADLPVAALSAPLDGSRYQPVKIDGDAGLLSITAGSGIIGGDLRLAAGGPSGRGGAIEITNSVAAPVIVTQRQTSAGPFLTVVADSINASGADDLTIAVAPNRNDFDNNEALIFAGDVSLHTARSIRLVAPMIGLLPGTPGNAILQSSYVSFEGLPAIDGVRPDLATPGGTLRVDADLIDFSRTVVLGCASGLGGNCGVSGFSKATFNSSGDIRFSDHDLFGNWASHAGLLSAGELDFQAAQVYVASRVGSPGDSSVRADEDPGFLVWSGQRIRILGNGGPTPVPLSFGERLTMRAPDIEQGGVLRAPQGEIRLEGRDLDSNATGSVNLLPGSLTSASLGASDGSGAAVVPFGSVLTGGVFNGYSQPGESPVKSVKLDAPAVSVAAGAVVDVSGGGDLLGYSFVPGNGGSSDVLAWRTNAAGQVVTDKKGNPLSALSLGSNLAAPFAIVPSLGTQPAPVARSSDLRDTRLKVGDQIWLQGVPGLADGYYTLLPSQYALLPGGRLIQPLNGAYATGAPSFTRPDGAVVASGYRSHLARDDSGNDRRINDHAFGQFVVMSKDVFLEYSQIATYDFGASAQALASESGIGVRTPNDAGSIVVAAQTSLMLQGTGRMGASSGGLLGNLDISGGQIAVVGPGGSGPVGYLTVQETDLTSFGAGSILIGGTRSATSKGTAVAVSASDVVVDTGGSTWAGAEILLAATSRISIADGSRISAQGTAAVDSNPLLLSGDGALLRLSTGSRVGLVRSNIPAAAAGSLGIGNATLSATGSLSLDGSRTVAFAPGLTFSTPQLDIASSDVHLGAVAPAAATGTWLSKDQVERLASSADLLIRGHDAIFLHGDLSLGASASGNAKLPGLTLDTGLLEDADGGTASITASRLTLKNSGGGGMATSGSGTLNLDLGSLVLGPGQMKVAGFATVSGMAGTSSVAGTGELDLDGTLSLQTGQVAVSSGASYAVHAAGNLTIGFAAGAAAPAPSSIGGSLSLQAANVVVDTAIALPAGSFQAKATAGSLTLGQHASIDVSGQSVDFFGQSRLAPAGTIRLDSSGDLAIAPGATLDVSGAAAGGDAGSVEVTAGGQASLQGSLRAQGATGSRGGAFALDASSIPSFSSLNALLQSGGFSDSIEVRLRGPGQSIRLGQNEAIAAHDVTLRSDRGQVIVAGTIGLDGDASHPAGGIIQLTGEDGVVLTGAARIDARAAASEKAGFVPASGEVLIAAGQAGTVRVSGATIDVSGGRSGGGSLVVRAPRVGDGLAIAELSGNFLGATERVVQGLQTYDATGVTGIDETWFATPLQDARAWLSAARARYPDGFNGFDLAPAIIVKSGGDLTITGKLSLAGVDGSGAPIPGGAGSLGFVSGGNIDVQGAVSDGFSSADRSASLLAGRSYSLSFAAAGDLTVEKNAMLRTGTGDISIRAGGSLTLVDPTSVIYTAGRRIGPAPGFLGMSGLPATAILGEFPADGGNVTLRVGGDIVAPITTQTTSAWLFRYGDTNWGGDAASSTVRQQTSWSVIFGNFDQGVGALGGGDVRVSAAGDIRQLEISIPTTGQLTAAPGKTANGADLLVRGGGDLRLSAGGDLIGGLVMLGEGLGAVQAGGSVVPSDRPGDLRGLRTAPPLVNQGLSRQVGILFGLMDAQVSVTAAGQINIEGAFDPGRQAQLRENLIASTGSAFWGYTDRTSLAATALAGAVTYQNDPWASLDLTLGGNFEVRMGSSGGSNLALNDEFSRAPPALRLTSLQSSVFIEDHFTSPSQLRLASAPTGTLEVMAGQDVFIARSVALDDIDPRYRHGPLDSFSTTAGAGGNITINLPPVDPVATNSQKGFVPIHQGDPDPLRIYALNGSVCAQRTASCTIDNPINVVSVVAPKPIEVIAGKDVVRGLYQPQNNGADDLSVLMAGRDVLQPIVLVTGTGAVLLQAGRDVLLGQGGTVAGNLLAGGAIYSLANAAPGSINSLSDPTAGPNLNQALSASRAADVYVLAGAAPGRVDYDSFAAAYLDPANGHGVVRTYLPELRAYLNGLEAKNASLSDAELVRVFEALSPARRELFLDRVYFNELKQTGIDYNDPKSPRYQSYNRGFRAVKTLFPADPAGLPASGRGNIILSGKAVETEAQANVVLLAPDGGVEVGTGLVPAFFNEVKYGGVVTRRGGDIQIMADENIDLFTSRVFTLQGGDITIWTSDGSITAGAGSKTSVFQKPLTYTMTKDGIVSVDAFGIQTGAGIGVLDALGNASDRPPSRLDLIAPRGEVNAGDAGIRVVGDLNIAAQAVVGVENIQATGASVGVPKVEVPNIASLTGATQVVQAASQEGSAPAAQLRNAAADLPSIITVEVVGYETTDAPAQPTDRDKTKDQKNAP